MTYHFDFAALAPFWTLLAVGALRTIGLTALSTVCGLALGILGAVSRAWRLPVLRTVFGVYVEIIRSTPFLVQLFFIFFGLPSLGVKMNAWEASILAMVINLGAYCTEIVRAGIEATPRGQLEAGESLALTRAQLFRHVVLRPALTRVWPAVASQVIIVMLGSSVCAQISATELTFAAEFIQSRNFRAFETYFVAAGIYLILAIALRRVLLWFGRAVLSRRP